VFLGESQHAMDAKGRVFVPKRFQEHLSRNAAGEVSAMLARGFEDCVFLFSLQGFERARALLDAQPFGGERLRKMQRLFFANSYEVALDANGRLLVPERLKVHAGLSKDVVMVGASERAEIWEAKRWDAYRAATEGDYRELGDLLAHRGDGAPRAG
jgi:MraZ protein